ncbi:ribosome maturation protein SBDS-like [Olea europaea var. sylvestris]|uniref:ribosome maturation protein SBDS-like n=1 Tax=Olea europaea var. sylvestris TaxID=158386 RepID=UPI000C1D069A|nr:ribosome maturation protein SBDS-like [Olea europaea var. sylvestris]
MLGNFGFSIILFDQKLNVRIEIMMLVRFCNREKDLDEVLQSHTVYSNVSKGVLAKSKDLLTAFGTDDQEKICLEILDEGELQVAGKERESQLSSQFRDIATMVMQKTINPETQRPYTISMIERLMHEIHFAVDPHSSSKKQALEVIRELQKHFPIKRSPMRLRLTVPKENTSSLFERINDWHFPLNFLVMAQICELDPSSFRSCDALVRNLQGRLEILAVNVHVDSDTQVDHYDDREDEPSTVHKDPAIPVMQLSEKLQQQGISVKNGSSQGGAKQNKCSTCNASIGNAKEYREHFKSDWHKHNLRRKTRQLPPLTAEECMADMELGDSKADLKEYSF